MSIRLWFVSLGTLVAALACGMAVQAQVATVSVKSANDLLSQFRTLAGAFDPTDAKPVLDAIDALENDATIKGLDRTKPIIATLDLIPNPQAGPFGLPQFTLFVPVTSQDNLLATLRMFGFVVDDQANAEGFSHKVVVEGGKAPPFFVLAKPPAGYTVATSVPAEPAKLGAIKSAELRPAKAGVAFANLRLDRIPDGLKETLRNQMKAQNDRTRQRKDGESDAAYRGRLGGQDLTEYFITTFIRDSRELALDLNVNADRRLASLSLEADAKPDTEMARSLAGFTVRSTQFRTVAPRAAVSLAGTLPMPDNFRSLMRDVAKTGREDAEKDTDPDSRRMKMLFIDATEPIITGPKFDGCIILDAIAPTEAGKDKKPKNVVLFGLALDTSKKLDAMLREAAAKAKDSKDVILDHDRGTDGTAIHKVVLNPKQLTPDEFGEPFMFVAFPEGAALAAVGGNALPVIKQALEARRQPAAATPKRAPQLELDVSAQRFAQLHLDDQQSFQQAAAASFTDKNAEKDHIQLSLTVEPTGIRIALETELPVLRFLAEAGARQKQK